MPILDLMAAAVVAGGAGTTDFGVREVGYRTLPGTLPVVEAARPPRVVPAVGSGNLSGAVAIAAQWGRVSSTHRSPEHNRRVGGVANSFHLSGRAIDIARRPGVNHWQIDAAFRRAGFRLVESLDEGDHSHFAFTWGGLWRPSIVAAAEIKATDKPGGTRWRVVYAPR